VRTARRCPARQPARGVRLHQCADRLVESNDLLPQLPPGNEHRPDNQRDLETVEQQSFIRSCQSRSPALSGQPGAGCFNPKLRGVRFARPDAHFRSTLADWPKDGESCGCTQTLPVPGPKRPESSRVARGRALIRPGSHPRPAATRLRIFRGSLALHFVERHCGGLRYVAAWGNSPCSIWPAKFAGLQRGVGCSHSVM
jgi:hypothetical protein